MTDLPDESSGNLIRSSRWNILLDKIEEGADTDVRIRGRYISFGTCIVLTSGSFASIYAPVLTGTVRGRILSGGTFVALTRASFQDAVIGTLIVQGGTTRARIVSAGTFSGTLGSFSTMAQNNVRGRILTFGTVVALTSGSFADLAATTSKFELMDDFWGSSLANTWSTTLTNGGTIAPNVTGGGANGQLTFLTTTTSGSDARLHTASVRVAAPSENPIFESRIYFQQNTQINVNIGLVQTNHDPTGAPAGTNHHAVFRVSAGASAASTLCSTADGITQSASQTINNVSGAWVKYKIAVTTADVKFYINDILRVTKVTNLPAANMMPFVGLDVPISTTARQIDVDYIRVTQDRTA